MALSLELHQPCDGYQHTHGSPLHIDGRSGSVCSLECAALADSVLEIVYGGKLDGGKLVLNLPDTFDAHTARVLKRCEFPSLIVPLAPSRRQHLTTSTWHPGRVPESFPSRLRPNPRRTYAHTPLSVA